MQIVSSIFIWVSGIIITLSAFLASLVIKIMPFPIRDREKKVHAQCFWWSDALVALNSYWKLKVEGLENIDHNQTYVIVANHQSLADIIIIYKTHLKNWDGRLLKIKYQVVVNL